MKKIVGRINMKKIVRNYISILLAYHSAKAEFYDNFKKIVRNHISVLLAYHPAKIVFYDNF